MGKTCFLTTIIECKSLILLSLTQMTITQTSFNLSDTRKDYNGWKDWTTWNAALWIGGDEGFYNIARECRDYIEFLNEMQMIGSHATPDGADWGEADLDEMNEMMKDL